MRSFEARSLALVLCLGLSLAAGCGREPAGEAPSDRTDVASEGAPEAAGAILVFPDRAGGLVPVRVPMTLPEDSESRLRVLVETLLAGPGDRDDLQAPFGEDVTLGDLHVDSRAVAYVDLVSETLADPPESGSRIELQRVFSVVNTILLNGSDVRSVVLLWNGRQRSTFSGHVDTGHPLRVDRGLLAGEAE